MDCARCEELLFERTGGARDDLREARVERHLAGCSRCVDLAALLAREAAGELAVPTELADAVLDRTIRVDGRLAAARYQLERDLPALAWLEPDADFTADVMAATVEADRRRLSRRVAAFWDRVIERPRFTLQAAYAAAMIVFLLVGLPASPLAGLPREASALIVDDERGAIRQVSLAASRATELGRATWNQAGELIDSVEPEVVRRRMVERWAPEIDAGGTAIGRWATATRDTVVAPAWEWLSTLWRDETPDSPVPSPADSRPTEDPEDGSHPA